MLLFVLPAGSSGAFCEACAGCQGRFPGDHHRQREGHLAGGGAELPLGEQEGGWNVALGSALD